MDRGRVTRETPIAVRRPRVAGVVCGFLSLIGVLPLDVRAEATGPLDAIAELRTKPFIPEADRTKIEQCVQQQVQTLLQGDLNVEGRRKIREEFRLITTREPAASEQFRSRFAAIVAQVVLAGLKSPAGAANKEPATSATASQINPAGAMLAAMMLYDLNPWLPPASLREGFGDALASPLPAVRFWIARTIRMKQKMIADLSATRETLLVALRQAAIRENDDPALREIYLAIDFAQSVSNPSFKDEVVSTLVDVLDARGKLIADGKLKCSEADTVGIAAVARLNVSMKDETRADMRRRYALALARILCGTTEAYAEQLSIADVSKRNTASIRRQLILVREVERELRRLVPDCGGPAKLDINVLARMQVNDPAQFDPTLFRDERNKWIGTATAANGVLNDKLFGVPGGAGFTTSSSRPASSSAPASQPKG